MRRLLVLAVAMLLVGCSSGDEATTTTVEQTTTTEATLTTEQVASVIAESGLPATIEDVGECFVLDQFCDPITPAITYGTLQAQAMTVVLNLDGLQDDGALPDELVDLVDETVSDATAVDEAVAAWTVETACISPQAWQGPVCIEANTAVQLAASSLDGTLASWGPYL